MSNVTILFESIEAAKEAFRTLKLMIDISLDCNALTFNEIDEELVKWLVGERLGKIINSTWWGRRRWFDRYWVLY